MNKTFEGSLKLTHPRGQYWLRLLLATILAVVLALAGTITWVSYQQTLDYLHPRREVASGALLRTRLNSRMLNCSQKIM